MPRIQEHRAHLAPCVSCGCKPGAPHDEACPELFASLKFARRAITSEEAEQIRGLVAARRPLPGAPFPTDNDPED